MKTKLLCGQNIIPLASILLALLFFVNSLASLDSADVRTSFVGFIVLFIIAAINLFRIIRKKGNQGINCVVTFLCVATAVVIGYYLLKML